jgi:paraquat-inducible protein A
MYRVVEFVGKWSMTDVFVVAILVALIQLGGLLSITAGSAAVAFGGVVVVTILAAESFDPRLIWDQMEEEDMNEGIESESEMERNDG